MKYKSKKNSIDSKQFNSKPTYSFLIESIKYSNWLTNRVIIITTIKMVKDKESLRNKTELNIKVLLFENRFSGAGVGEERALTEGRFINNDIFFTVCSWFSERTQAVESAGCIHATSSSTSTCYFNNVIRLISFYSIDSIFHLLYYS